MFVKATSYANFALIKYWGKKDEVNILPYNDSLSITWDAFKTYTILESSSTFKFILNNEEASEKETKKVKLFLKHFTDNIDNVRVMSQNNFPTAAGLASSASAFSALAVCANQFFKTNYDMKTLSQLTAKGSGSAVRSLYGGAVRWNRDGRVYPLDVSLDDYALLVVIINPYQKSISSTEAMKHTVKTSPFYEAWVQKANHDINLLEDALENDDFNTVGHYAQQSSMAMHANMLASDPYIRYLNDDTFKALETVKQLKDKGIECFYTMDAGANVKIITKSKHVNTIKDALMTQGFDKFYTGNVAKKGAHISDEG